VAIPGGLKKEERTGMSDLLCFTKAATARGSIQMGRKPHINLYGAKYSSEMLKQAPGLIGKRISISIDLQDLRSVRACAESGEELGVLCASYPWHLKPHTLKMRQEIGRLGRLARIHKQYEAKNSLPIMIAYLDYLEKQGIEGHVVPVPYIGLRRFVMELDEADRARVELTPYEKPADEEHAAPQSANSRSP